MSGRRTGAFGAIAGLAAAWVWAASAAPLGCGGDAFTAATDAGPHEASTPLGLDGAPGDASKPDGGGEVDAGAGWCASHGSGHTFCEDFFDGVPDQLVEKAFGGSITADTTDYESAPRSMATSIPSLAKGAQATAFAAYDLAKTPGSQIVVSSFYEVAASCFPANGAQNPVSILGLDFASSNYELLVTVLPSSVLLVEVTTDADGGNMKVQEQSVQATGLVGAWQDWTLTVDGSALAKSATLTVGNATLFDKVNLKSAPVVAALQHPVVYFGVTATNNAGDMTPACKVHVDDILIDARAVAVAAAANVPLDRLETR